VNGYKKWITGMPTATHMTTAVRTGGPGMGGISVIVIPVNSKGFTWRRIPNSGQNGGGASFVEMDDVHVPVENLLGKENEGFRIIMTNFNKERFIMSIGCNRKARTCLSESFEYANKRHTFGKPLISNQIISHKLATIGRYVESHWAWLEQLAYHIQQSPLGWQDPEIAGQIALTKVHGGRILEMANREAQQIFGGAGYQKGGPGAIVEQMSRDLRMMVRLLNGSNITGVANVTLGCWRWQRRNHCRPGGSTRNCTGQETRLEAVNTHFVAAHVIVYFSVASATTWDLRVCGSGRCCKHAHPCAPSLYGLYLACGVTSTEAPCMGNIPTHVDTSHLSTFLHPGVTSRVDAAAIRALTLHCSPPRQACKCISVFSLAFKACQADPSINDNNMGEATLCWPARLLLATASLANLPIIRAFDISTTTIASWKLASTRDVGINTAKLSAPDFNTSSWYTLGSRGTLMATLIENGIYNETSLFYSNNLQDVDIARFRVPWFYRTEFEAQADNGTFTQLITNGISSRADFFLNKRYLGGTIGAYAGSEVDITDELQAGKNVLLVKVYPTDYNRDFALGFVDWNPYPPDNGTGIWRDVQIRKSGQITIDKPRVRTTLDGDVDFSVSVKNLGNTRIEGRVQCAVTDPDGKEIGTPRTPFGADGGRSDLVALHLKIDSPKIWYPSQWGDQPLYSVLCTATNNSNSFVAAAYDQTPITKFGIRTVTSRLDSYNDTVFAINDQPFQVIGAGYTSDIFLRFDIEKLRRQFKYVLDMGLNAVRVEGKQEHPELYNLADEMGIMLLPGWECCDKWEAWTYNEEKSGKEWDDKDYETAARSMAHEASMMQNHPSVLGFLVGSDYWPDNRATDLYVNTLRGYNWTTPIIASASQHGYPERLGNGGMKMTGPYDWVPPNYWYDTDDGNDTHLGAAFGFGSELGAGVGTPEQGSLKKFLDTSDLDDLWQSSDKGLYHMSTNVSSFYTRSIYNEALSKRYGTPTSLDDYTLKAQMADYEATRAQFEAYLSRWKAERPATGMIYWMLNNAWPSLHWNLFDYYMHPGGSYFGTKAALGNLETAVFDYHSQDVYYTNRALSVTSSKARQLSVEIIDLAGNTVIEDLNTKYANLTAEPNTSNLITHIPALRNTTSVVLLRLTLTSPDQSDPLSQNTYWLAPQSDILDWDNSTWYHTPVSSYSNLTALSTMDEAKIVVRGRGKTVQIENASDVPAVFVRLNLVDEKGEDVVPVVWETNYITLWPRESYEIAVDAGAEWNVDDLRVVIDGRNVEKRTVRLNGGTQVLPGDGFRAQ
jgi:exo-1,4-beta-D-glucosaminidase